MLREILCLALCLISGVHGYWKPSPGTTFQWQLQGTIDLHVSASVFDIDLFDAKDSDISYLKSHGEKVICYFSAGSHENWRNDVSSVPSGDIGNKLDGWAGEHWWDITSSAVHHVIQKRLDLAKSRGCDAVEPDNVDGYANNNGLGLSKTDQITFNKWLASEAHHRGLSVGLKNAVDLIDSLESSFDWAINEECLSYDECGGYKRFLDHHKAVFHVEYVDHHSQGSAKKNSVCHDSNRPSGFTTLIKDWDLTSWRLTC
ncbi:uncharacterized protein [Littorina saxatilis]|uniref:Glycoside-hydrolase family GH114 TIM-barrel domain-containing protein n=1 Tax=Littorina saxatilis TaxID=31220 RepID=A0AAN9BQ95_9CAEN